jgi:hypothetical protein
LDEHEHMRAVLDAGLEQISRAVDDGTHSAETQHSLTNTGDGQTAWVAWVRAGLVALLGFLDDEPAWGSFLCVQAPRVGALGLDSQRRLSAMLGDLIVGGGEEIHGTRTEGHGPLGFVSRSEITTELVVGGVLAVIRTYLAEIERDTSCVELAPSLMAFIVTPYLGQAAASAELAGISESPTAASLELEERSSAVAPLGARVGDERVSPRGRWVSGSARSQKTGGVGGSPGGELARRSIVNREDKGVVDK